MQRVFFFLALTALPAAGQWRHFGRPYLEPTGFVGVGGSTGVNPLARRLDAGWNFTGGFGVTQGYAGVMADFMFTDFGITHTALVREGARSGYQRFWAITADPIVHVNPRGPIDFYLNCGRRSLRPAHRTPSRIGPLGASRTGPSTRRWLSTIAIPPSATPWRVSNETFAS